MCEESKQSSVIFQLIKSTHSNLSLTGQGSDIRAKFDNSPESLPLDRLLYD